MFSLSYVSSVMAYQATIVCFFVLICNSESARILGIVPTPSYSHQVAFQPIWKELSLRGHQVVTITTDPIRDPNLVNLTEIDLHSAYDVWNKHIRNMTTESTLTSFTTMFTTMFEVNDYELSHPLTQNLMKNNSEHFDVVIVEAGFVSMYAFAERFEAPLVTVLSLDAPAEFFYMMGNPIHSMLYPSCLLPFHYDLLFHERLLNALFQIISISTTFIYHQSQNAFITKYFGNNYRSVQELTHNISLMLLYSDPIFHKVKPMLPTIVEFGGGTHRVAPKPLRKELQDSLDAAEHGFIYFSLGSNVKSTFLTEEIRRVIMDTFAELPYKVLWKFEDDNLPSKPSNVITSKWLPQQDILRHPNIKLFITQGGQQSIEEALYDYVPMLIMPFFGDQQSNAYRMVAKGCGLTIDYRTLTKENFKTSILEVINNPSYKNKIRELAKLAQDEPMTGLEKAIWWIEYVIRRKGTAHLRSPYLDMPFYQYYYLDVIAVFAASIFVLIKIIVLIAKVLKKIFIKLFYVDAKLKTT